MARTAVTVTEVNRTSPPAVPAQQTSDTANGMTIPNHDGRVLVELEASGGNVTLEALIPGSVDGSEVASKKLVLLTGEKKLIGPFPTGVYNQPDGSLSLNFSTASGKIRAYHY